jgi:NAD-dependent dihydropyrimidine dehydrogenase PreA subunit
MMGEDLRYTNLTSLLIWVVWWPMIIFLVLFAGRAWCMVCHQKFIADSLGGFGLQWKVPRWITKHGVTIVLTMILGVFVLHTTVTGYGVSNFAYMSAIYLIIIVAYPVVISLLFEKSAYCKSFCPLIGFLGNYTRCSPTELRSADPEKCKACKDKECVKHCQNRLYMGTMDAQQQEGCLLCMQCVKYCPNDNITFRLRSFFKGLWDSPKRSVAGTLAVALLLGIVLDEVGEEWKVVDDIAMIIPNIMINLTGFETIFDTATGGYAIWGVLFHFIFLPTAVFGLMGFASTLLARGESAWNYIKIYALAFVPLILSLHITKQFYTFNGNLGYLPQVITDPFGKATAEAIKTGAMQVPGEVFLSSSTEGWLLMLFIAAFGVGGSLYSAWKISKISFEDDARQGILSAAPFMLVTVLVGIVFILTVYNWMIAV